MQFITLRTNAPIAGRNVEIDHKRHEYSVTGVFIEETKLYYQIQEKWVTPNSSLRDLYYRYTNVPKRIVIHYRTFDEQGWHTPLEQEVTENFIHCMMREKLDLAAEYEHNLYVESELEQDIAQDMAKDVKRWSESS